MLTIDTHVKGTAGEGTEKAIDMISATQGSASVRAAQLNISPVVGPLSGHREERRTPPRGGGVSHEAELELGRLGRPSSLTSLR